MSNEFNFSPDLATAKLSEVLSKVSNEDIEEILPVIKSSALATRPDYANFPPVEVTQSGLQKTAVMLAEAGFTVEGTGEYHVMMMDCTLKALNYIREEKRGLLDKKVDYDIAVLETLMIREKTKQAIEEMEYKLTVERLKTDWEINQMKENIRYQSAVLENEREKVRMIKLDRAMTLAQQNEVDYLMRMLDKDSRKYNGFWSRLNPFNNGKPSLTADMIRRGDY